MHTHPKPCHICKHPLSLSTQSSSILKHSHIYTLPQTTLERYSTNPHTVKYALIPMSVSLQICHTPIYCTYTYGVFLYLHECLSTDIPYTHALHIYTHTDSFSSNTIHTNSRSHKHTLSPTYFLFLQYCIDTSLIETLKHTPHTIPEVSP